MVCIIVISSCCQTITEKEHINCHPYLMYTTYIILKFKLSRLFLNCRWCPCPAAHLPVEVELGACNNCYMLSVWGMDHHCFDSVPVHHQPGQHHLCKSMQICYYYSLHFLWPLLVAGLFIIAVHSPLYVSLSCSSVPSFWPLPPPPLSLSLLLSAERWSSWTWRIRSGLFHSCGYVQSGWSSGLTFLRFSFSECGSFHAFLLWSGPSNLCLPYLWLEQCGMDGHYCQTVARATWRINPGPSTILFQHERRRV